MTAQHVAAAWLTIGLASGAGVLSLAASFAFDACRKGGQR